MSDGGWTQGLSPKAQDGLDALASDEQDRILGKLDDIVDSPWRDPPDYGEPLRKARRRRPVSASFDSPWSFERANGG
jgi:hypothetical protein